MTAVNPSRLHLLDNLTEVVKFQYIMCTLTQFTGSLQFVSCNFVFSFHINAPVSWVPTAGHAAGTVVSSAVTPLSRPLTAKHVGHTDDRAISSAPLVLLKTYLFSLYPAAGLTGHRCVGHTRHQSVQPLPLPPPPSHIKSTVLVGPEQVGSTLHFICRTQTASVSRKYSAVSSSAICVGLTEK